jgi:hypothetical protein
LATTAMTVPILRLFGYGGKRGVRGEVGALSS